MYAFPPLTISNINLKKKNKTQKNAVPLRNSVNVLVTLKNASITSCSNESLPSHKHDRCGKSLFA